MSFNIRYDNPDDGINAWENRKSDVLQLIEYYNADIIGIQEALPNQEDYLKKELPKYGFIGHGRDGDGTNSEGIPILFNKSKIELVDERVFWLSETPNIVSKGWDAAINRIVVYGKFKILNTQSVIHVFNCHFDHEGVEAREKSAQLVIDLTEQLCPKNEKIIILGDFNCQPDTTPIQILKNNFKDSYENSEKHAYGPEGTFNGFIPDVEISNRIDYILTKNLRVCSFRHIDDRRKNNLFPSDHLPILITTE